MIVLNRKNPRGLIWLASYPRSGNTWTRAFLNALLNVMRDPAFADIDINRIEEFTASESAAAQYRRFLGKPAFKASRAEIAAARPKVQAAIVAAVNQPIFVKTHNANVLDHGVPVINLMVSAGAVYIVRDPRDVAVSFAHLRNMPLDRMIDDLGASGFHRPADRDNVHIVTGSWSEHVRSWTERPSPAVLVVRYEDLIEKPTETFGSIARHLLLQPTDEQLQRAIAMASFGRLRAKEEAAGFKEKPEASVLPFFRKGEAGQWREVLSEAQAARIELAHGPMMRRFGYLPAAKAEPSAGRPAAAS